MRWKLLFITSSVAALIACGLWSAFTLVFFGSFRRLAAHGLLVSTFLPLIVAGSVGLFIYRHTAKQRKLQAMLTATLTLLLTVAMYLLVMPIFSLR
jgi:hypothetical protein